MTDRVAARSADMRSALLRRLDEAKQTGAYRSVLVYGKLAHSFAVSSPADDDKLGVNGSLNLGIVGSYNEILYAHQSPDPSTEERMCA
ncbi:MULTISPECIES: hypothetical protein [unclassified Mesorhizobium]|uniref:hypothetical protein n=1 Tax=unclassified Mesorhizobium TaxID=325217 RepID=UPI00241627E1|nr:MULTISPECIES: hypothetical protein [unclassified Mesorhizobium]WFP65619.1 hypothetical protein QAZ47_14265 [Mesorhizobium sp. WSM4904]WFP78883.1 hypothetical protein QAZ22_14205 [Mesorhizobium sp. WSM4906]